MLKPWFIIGISFLPSVKNKMYHSAEYIKAYWLRKQHIYSYLFRAILEHDFESPPVQNLDSKSLLTPHIDRRI